MPRLTIVQPEHVSPCDAHRGTMGYQIEIRHFV